MLNFCLNVNESQPIYAYKRYGYRKRVYRILSNICSGTFCGNTYHLLTNNYFRKKKTP